MNRMRAFLVLGPESSGTRLMTSILISGGCLGNADHYQWWDDHSFTRQDMPIVWRRSYPHGFGWPDIGSMLERLRMSGRSEVAAVVMVRAMLPSMCSLVERGHAPDLGLAGQKLKRSCCRVFRDLETHGLDFVVVTYEGLVAEPDNTQAWLQETLGFPTVPTIDIRNANDKHWRANGHA